MPLIAAWIALPGSFPLMLQQPFAATESLLSRRIKALALTTVRQKSSVLLTGVYAFAFIKM
jgi:hypothetical protein